MNSLYLEGYEHAIFDLTRHNRVQVQVSLSPKPLTPSRVPLFISASNVTEGEAVAVLDEWQGCV